MVRLQACGDEGKLGKIRNKQKRDTDFSLSLDQCDKTQRMPTLIPIINIHKANHSLIFITLLIAFLLNKVRSNFACQYKKTSSSKRD